MIVISLCWLAGRASATNIVVNGDFSGMTSSVNVDGVFDVLPFGWGDNGPTPGLSKLNVVAAGSLPGSPADPLGSGFYMAFQSPAQDGTQDCFSQIFNTIANHTYTLSFWLALTQSSNFFQLTPDWDVTGGAHRQFLQVVGTSPYDSFANGNFDHAVTNLTAAMPFQQFSYTLTASSSSTFTYFHGVDSGGGAVLLADVSLTDNSVPEPISLWLIGLGLVILGFRKKATRARA